LIESGGSIKNQRSEIGNLIRISHVCKSASNN
jgi:hypothetical protein